MSTNDQNFHSRSSQPCEELVSELAALVQAEGERADPWRFRALLRLILGEAWAGVARGDFAVLRGLLRGLGEAEEIVRPHLPDPGEPRTEAAREVFFTAYVLHVAEGCVRPEKTRARLGERQRSAFERKVLQVLLEHTEEYLRRAEIVAEMKKLLPPPYPDPSRVSQILSELHDERLVMRTYESAQGNAQTSFFTLSRQGIELCRRLDLDEPRRLFEADSAKWHHLLRPSRLAVGSDEKARDERIAAFYRPRPGVGCSLALAHCSVLLAQQVHDLEPARVLLLDLEGEESSLQDYFGGQARSCRGLAGLLEDYQARPEEKRRDWLAGAIFDGDYACRPVRELDNLFYLPPFPRREQADQFHLYAGLMRDLRREIERQERRDGAPAFAASGFLGDLRHAMREECAKALVQSPAGLGPGAYVASVLFAEELVLFLHPNDPERESIRAMVREVMGNCLWRGAADAAAEPSITFVFSPVPLEEELKLSSKIELFLTGGEAVRERAIYRVVPLHFDARLAWGRLPRLGTLDPDPSLLAAGYHNLVEVLHPQSSLVPAHWQNKEQELQERVRLRLVETQLGAFPRPVIPGAPPGPAAPSGALGPPPLEPQAVFRHEEDLEPAFEALEAVGVG